jgi:cytochrome c peroxidase
MHNGLFPELEELISLYNSGMQIKPRPEWKDDPMFPKTDKIMRPLRLTVEERDALVAFLHAASNRPMHVNRPSLPE